MTSIAIDNSARIAGCIEVIGVSELRKACKDEPERKKVP